MMREQENGYILVTAILLLMVLTVIGMAAMGTSSIENILSGNIRIIEENEALADSGIKHIPKPVGDMIMLTAPAEYTAYLGTSTDISNLIDELRGDSFDTDNTDASPDMTYVVDGTTVSIDIDKVSAAKSEGFAIMTHNCYEGVGRCDGKGAIYFRVNSEASIPGIGAQTTAGSFYIYVDK
ncbi:MAG: pilus assembly PilX N-terminal domain-containing protein [Nitrospirota bacterium]